jgi:hypothetical protein
MPATRRCGTFFQDLLRGDVQSKGVFKQVLRERTAARGSSRQAGQGVHDPARIRPSPTFRSPVRCFAVVSTLPLLANFHGSDGREYEPLVAKAHRAH